MTDTVKWLTTVPASDLNFKIALERATVEDIRIAIEELDGKKETKTKMLALERELRKKLKQEGKENEMP